MKTVCLRREAPDLYSLGAVGYFLLTGVQVFEAKSVIEVCTHHLNTAPVPPSQRVDEKISPQLEQLILRSLEKDPARRPATAVDLENALASCGEAGSWDVSQARERWVDLEKELSKAAGDRGAQLKAERRSTNLTLTIDRENRLPAEGGPPGHS